MRQLLILLLVYVPVCVQAQISGIINSYTKVTLIDPSCNKITVTSTAGFSQGDTVLIIQMKGASIDQTSTNTSYGNITAYNEAGNYEFAHIYAISGNDIYLRNQLLRSYNPAGSVQLVSVPQYTDIEIGGTLTAQPWNGATGGVLVFEASGTVTMNANMDVSGLGFRGYAPNTLQPASGPCNTNTFFAARTNDVTSAKGESISDSIPGKEFGRGKQANGGGGGNSNNTGGGGGSNYNTGGDGGYQSSGCFLGAAGNPGRGGAAVTYSNAMNKVFLGGGGGAGHQNNFMSPGPPTRPGATRGGNGGGIVIVKAGAINGNNRYIYANGNEPPSYSYGDGSGGGGGGGAILLSVNNYASGFNAEVKGGKGGDVYDETGRDLGPGGGGGGGVVWTSTAPGVSISVTATGGASGISTRKGIAGLAALCECAHGAVAGGNGGTLTGLVLPVSTTLFSPPCIALPVDLLDFHARWKNNMVRLSWTTSWEKNNDYFILERSQDLQHYETIATVEGQMNSTDIQRYLFDDKNPLEGVTYYRLSQRDIDGKTVQLGIRVITFYREKLVTSIYPVPFTTTFTVQLNPKIIAGAEVRLIVFNSLGEMVYENTSTDSSSEIDLAHQAPGMYHLLVQSSEMLETLKLIKAR